jgi:hypothetical protein
MAAPMRDRTYLQQQQQQQQQHQHHALQRHVTSASLSCLQGKLQRCSVRNCLRAAADS